MKAILALLPLCLTILPASAYACDCTKYPFMPNPPCYSACVARLYRSDISVTRGVTNIDPDVVTAVQAMQKQGISNVDFGAIGDKEALEKAVRRNELPWKRGNAVPTNARRARAERLALELRVHQRAVHRRRGGGSTSHAGAG